MARSDKVRLDSYLVETGQVETRAKAQALILAGKVFVNQAKAEKSGIFVTASDVITLKQPEKSWVSRGAYKLLTAVERFGLDLNERVCLDVGASTGGFSEVMLHFGALRVYAVDVGYGQLAWSLRNDDRVVVMERQNARFLTPDMFEPAPSFATSDASFISLKLLLEPMASCLTEDGRAVVLVKPQFEAGKERIGKGGVVKDPAVHLDVLLDLASFIEDRTAFDLLDATWSSITGPKGNIEYLFYLAKGSSVDKKEINMSRIVEESHIMLDRKGCGQDLEDSE